MGQGGGREIPKKGGSVKEIMERKAQKSGPSRDIFRKYNLPKYLTDKKVVSGNGGVKSGPTFRIATKLWEALVRFTYTGWVWGHYRRDICACCG